MSFLDTLRAHEGVWHGEYQIVDLTGAVIDRHRSEVRCEFPANGDYAYVQHNRFTWDDGREEQLSFGGVLDGDRLVWDNERFAGYAWATDGGIILLRLERKDSPGMHFLESIVVEPGHDVRVRTWHWFEHGVPVKRTLCNERRVTRSGSE
ncbi:MAG: hypothetical protein AAGC71_04980 [Pseudomonadota bacterium]